MVNKPLLIACVACFLIFLIFYGVTSRARFQSVDETMVFATGISLATKGTLAVDNLLEAPEILSNGVIGRGGHLYSRYFPGIEYTIALVYRIMEKPGDQPFLVQSTIMAPSLTGAIWATKVNAFFGALAMAALLASIKRYFNWKTTVCAVILIGISSDWWYQSRGMFSEVGAGAFLILALCAAIYKKPYLCSLAIGISLLFRPTNLLALPIWGWAVWENKKKSALWSITIIILSIGILAYFNWIRFGSWFDFGYGNENFSGKIFIGLFGLLFSPGRSIFVYSPILVLALLGLLQFSKRDWKLVVVSLSTLLAYVLLIAAWQYWDGGISWGSRLLTPILPLFGFYISPAIQQGWIRKWDLVIVVVLALLGFGIQVIALMRDPLVSLFTFIYIHGEAAYGQTLFSLNNSWINLQLKSMQQWQPCDLDAYTIRHMLFHCLY